MFSISSIRILILILVLAAMLRFSGLGNNSFVADEFLDINSTYGYHQTGEWRAWDFNFGAPSAVSENVARDERAALYKWQVAQLFSFLSPTEAVARSISAIWGIFAILAVFWSAWIFTRRQDISLVAAFFCTISVSAIIFSRRLRMYAMFFPLYLVAATAWYAFYEEEYRGKFRLLRVVYKRLRVHLGYLILAIPLTLLSFLTHALTIHLFLSLGVYLLICLWLTRHEYPLWYNRYFLSVVAGAICSLSLLVAHPELLRYIPDRLEDHFGYITHLFCNFSTLPVGIALVSFGLIFWGRRSEAAQMKASLYLGLSFLIPLFFAVFLWLRNVGAQYIYFIQSFVMIGAAIGTVSLFTLMRERFQLSSKRATAILGITCLILIPNWGYFFEENNTYHETSTGENPNYRKIFTFFKKEKQSDDSLVTRNFRNYYWSGTEVPVYDFGGELSKQKLSLSELQAIERSTAGRVWFIASDNDLDYVAREVEIYLAKQYEQVSNDQVRGSVVVYRSIR